MYVYFSFAVLHFFLSLFPITLCGRCGRRRPRAQANTSRALLSPSPSPLHPLSPFACEGFFYWLSYKISSLSNPSVRSVMSSSTVSSGNPWVPRLASLPAPRKSSLRAPKKLSSGSWPVGRRIACACSAPPRNWGDGRSAFESHVSSSIGLNWFFSYIFSSLPWGSPLQTSSSSFSFNRLLRIWIPN